MKTPKTPENGTIDLTNPSVQEWVLRHDKQTRLEGLCVEHVFRQLLVKPYFNNDMIAGEWWFKAEGSSFRPIKLIRESKLDKVDCKCVDIFVKNGIEPAFIYYNTLQRQFYAGSRKEVFNNGNLDLNAFRPVKMRRNGAPSIKNEIERQSRAIRFLQKRNLLQDAAIQRYVANWILAGRRLWDLDCFVLHENQIIAFEVKQKFPTRKGTFGLNFGLKNLFDWLERMDIPVFHLVLTKPVWHENFPAVEFLENKLFWKYATWLAIRSITIHKNSAQTGIAPAKTSIHKTGNLKFYHIPISDFFLLGPFIDAKESMPDLIAGKALKDTDLKSIPRLNSYTAKALC